MLVVDRFLAHARATPDKILFEFANDQGQVVQRYTYGEFEAKTRALALSLVQHKGQCALLVYPPGLDFICAFVACLRAGVVAVPVYPPRGVKNKDLAMFLSVAKSCQAKLALTNSAYNWGTKVLSMRELLRAPFTSTSSSSNSDEARGAWPEQLQWMVTDGSSHGNTSSSSLQIDTDLLPANTAFLQYTSGSTALPKGVVLTHDNLAHNLETICLALRADSTVQVVSWLPMYHDMGLIGSHLGTMYCGGSALLFSPLTFVKNPVLWLELVTRKRATHLQAPNFAYKLTTRKFLQQSTTCKLDLSSVRHCFNAAEPIDPAAVDEFCTTFSVFGFANEAMVPGFGLAEHTVYVCDGGRARAVVDRAQLETQGRAVDVDKNKTDKANTAVMTLVGLGRPPAGSGVRVLIVDPVTREPLQPDCVGEIWVTSRSKSAEYFGLPELSQRDLHARLKEQEQQEEPQPAGASTTPEVRVRASSSSGMSDAGHNHAVLPRRPATPDELALEWLRTGDLGFIRGDDDENAKQELFVCGRIKDLVVIRGRNHFPQDLEHTAEASAGGGAALRPGCVGAFAVTAGGEEDRVVIVAEVRQQQQQQTSLDAVCDAIRVSIASEHGVAVSAICLVQERTIPKTTSGKLSRHRIRDAYLSGALQVVYEWKTSSAAATATNVVGLLEAEEGVETATPSTTTTPDDILLQLKREVVSLLELQHAAEEVDATCTMQVLGFDSMMLTQLKGAVINLFHVEVDDEVLYGEACTLERVRDMIVDLQQKKKEPTQPAAAATTAQPQPPPQSRKQRRPWISGIKKGQKCGFCGC